VEGGDRRLARPAPDREVQAAEARGDVTSQAGGAGKDWIAWHRDYDDDTPLHHRLLAVQRRIREALTSRPAGPIRVVSACAGEGRDLFGVLVDHPRAIDVQGRLVELDRVLATRAAGHAPPGIEVVRADAGSTDAYVGAVPADLVLVCGVFGNISDEDVSETIAAQPTLCAVGATVIWTRHRRPPDLTIDVRRWFEGAGFEPLAFDAPAEFEWSVGVQRFVADPAPIEPGRRLFSFVTTSPAADLGEGR
jgi:hypothetical protein